MTTTEKNQVQASILYPICLICEEGYYLSLDFVTCTACYTNANRCSSCFLGNTKGPITYYYPMILNSTYADTLAVRQTCSSCSSQSYVRS